MNDCRRRLLQHLLVGVTGLIVACNKINQGGSSNSAGGVNANCNTNGGLANIHTNHGHTLTLSAADVTIGVDKTYDITGAGGHAHSVTISAAQFAILSAGGSLMGLTSTANGHTHTVDIICA